MTDAPLVSICIPTYNRAEMVRQTIESALNQTYSNIEVVVVDDCSADNTADVVAMFHDSRLRYVKNPRNLGQFGNCNHCIDLAQGKYIHILHSDDYIDPNFTELCVRFLEAHPEVSLTYSSAHFTCGNKTRDIMNFPKDTIFSPPEGFRQILQENVSIICPSVMVRREVYRNAGYFSQEYPYAGDYYQWLRFSRKYTIAYVKDAWINYRIGEHSESYAYLITNPIGYIDLLKIYTRIVVELGDDRDKFLHELNYALYQFIRNALSAGLNRSEAMPLVSSAFFYGIALSSLSLVKVNSFNGWLKKIRYSLIIHLMGFCMSSALTKKLIRPFLGRKQIGY